MDIWVNVIEIAEAKNINRRNVLMRSEKEQWTKRKRKGRGGGFEYLVAELPADIKQALEIRETKRAIKLATQESPAYIAGKTIAEKIHHDKVLDEKVKARISQQGAAELMQLTGKAKLKAEVKLCILATYDTYLVPYIAKNKKTMGEKVFAEQYNSQELGFDAQAYEVVPSISWNYPRRWKKILVEEGAAALGGRYKRENLSKIDKEPDMQLMAQGIMYHEPEIAASHLRELLIAHSELGELNWDVPSVGKTRVWITKFKQEHPLLVAKLNNPDDFKNRYQVAFGKANGDVTHINQRWELDSTPTDVHLLDGRYSIIGAIDVFSRRPIVILHPTSSSEGVCLLLRKAMLEFGVPESVKTDNGKDYVSKRVTTVLQSLGVKQDIAPPFAGEAKSKIERFFGTWSHGISKLLPGYGGHDVASREKLQARASFADRILKKGSADITVELTARELQVIIDDWIEHYYNHEVHSTTKEKPIVRWHSQRTTIRSIENERALDILLSPVPASGKGGAGVRTVTKDVGIAVEGFSFVAPELGALIGQKVFCSWNPENVGELYVFHSHRLEFICKAICPELAETGKSLAEITKEAKRQQNAKISEQKAKLRKAKNSVNLGEAAKNVIAAAKKRNSSLTGMPLPSKAADSGLLRQAAYGSEQNESPTQLSADNFQKLRQEQIELDKAREAAQSAKPRFSSEYEQYCWILQQQKVRQLSPEEIILRENYKSSNPKWAKQASAMIGESEELKQEEN